MIKGKVKAFNASLVECPFCKERVKAKALASHAKRHRGINQNLSNQPIASLGSHLSGVEIQNSDMAANFKHLVIDESGILVNPNVLKEEHRKSLDERLRNVSLPTLIKKKYKNKSDKSSGDIEPSRAIDDIYRQKVEWLNKLPHANGKTKSSEQTAIIKCPFCKVSVKVKRLSKHLAKTHTGLRLSNEEIFQLDTGDISGFDFLQSEKSKKPEFAQEQIQVNTYKAFHQSSQKDKDRDTANLVKCPLCKHKTKYNVLFVHIQVSHPEVNPKIVMSKFNQAYKSKNSSDKGKHEEGVNELVKDYERLKQGQDESRDGGKYMGHIRRENGKFGSLPLYDDYSDEANAD